MKFHVSNKHYDKYCSTPNLDKNVEEVLVSSSFSNRHRSFFIPYRGSDTAEGIHAVFQVFSGMADVVSSTL